MAPSTHREDRVICLTRDGTVLLYTDGLVERRDRDVDAGTAELIEVLREYAGLPLEELCDRVLERLFLPDAEDDVAILAVRLHPQGEPRPPESGPQIVPESIEPAPDVLTRPRPEGQSVARRPRRRPSRVRVRAGRSTATGASSPATPTAPVAATSTMTDAATGRGPGPPARQAVSATAPISAATALYGPGWTMSARWARSTSRMSAPPTPSACR